MKCFSFGVGSHESRDDGMCVMEAAAYLAGEEHSDTPQCASPVITQTAIALNDDIVNDDRRNEVCGDLPWRVVGTVATNKVELRRICMLTTAVINSVLAHALHAFGLRWDAHYFKRLVVDENTNFSKLSEGMRRLSRRVLGLVEDKDFCLNGICAIRYHACLDCKDEHSRRNATNALKDTVLDFARVFNLLNRYVLTYAANRLAINCSIGLGSDAYRDSAITYLTQTGYNLHNGVIDIGYDHLWMGDPAYQDMLRKVLDEMIALTEPKERVYVNNDVERPVVLAR